MHEFSYQLLITYSCFNKTIYTFMPLANCNPLYSLLSASGLTMESKTRATGPPLPASTPPPAVAQVGATTPASSTWRAVIVANNAVKLGVRARIRVLAPVSKEAPLLREEAWIKATPRRWKLTTRDVSKGDDEEECGGEKLRRNASMAEFRGKRRTNRSVIEIAVENRRRCVNRAYLQFSPQRTEGIWCVRGQSIPLLKVFITN